MQKTIRNLVLSAFFLALALILPFLTGQIPQIGNTFLPMHLPVLLCGFLVGGPWGLVVGLIAPILRSLFFGMPPLYPTALAMTFELGAYGLLAGLFYNLFPKKILHLYVSLILAMIGGRLVWGLATLALLGIRGEGFTAAAFLSGAVLNAVPGIVIQLVLIPAIVFALQRARLIPAAK